MASLVKGAGRVLVREGLRRFLEGRREGRPEGFGGVRDVVLP